MSSKTTSLFLVVLSLAIFSLSFSNAFAGEPDIIFTGCPPYVEGNHCDSMFYQVVAVDLNTGKAVSGVRYHLIEGKGTINEKTGLWQYHPEDSEYLTEFFDVEIAASFRGDTTSAEDNCRFDVRVRDSRQRSFYPRPGAHRSVLPGETFRMTCRAEDIDECDTYIFSIYSVSPQPDGALFIDPLTNELTFSPTSADSGSSFFVMLKAEVRNVAFNSSIVFDVFHRTPTQIRVGHGRVTDFGKRVSVPIEVSPSDLEAKVLDLSFAFDRNLLHWVGYEPGPGIPDLSDSCGWQTVQAGTYSADGIAIARVRITRDYLSETCSFSPSDPPVVVAYMTFETYNLYLTDSLITPLSFFWADPSRNIGTNDVGEYALYCSEVFDWQGNQVSYTGLPGYSLDCDSCFLDGYGNRDSDDRYRNLEFHGGSVTILPRSSGELNYNVSIELEDGDGMGAYQGQFTEVTVSLDEYDSEEGLGGFDLLFTYDHIGLNFQEAVAGQIYDDCGWEYFTFRFGPDGNCDDCPPGLMRVIGIAETNNGPYHPTCDVDTDPVDLFDLVFLVTNDRSYEGAFVPVRFFWIDCGDNVVMNEDGSELFINASIYDLVTEEDISDGQSGFPGYAGAHDVCLLEALPNRPLPTRQVDFKNGGVQIISPGNIDGRGDINLNGVAYEIADLVMFWNYFLNGLSAFGIHVDASIVVSDVNANEVPLELADFFFMNAVVIGDALPHSQLDPTPWSLHLWDDDFSHTIRFEAAEDVAGLLLIVAGDFEPSSTNELNQYFRYYDGTQTKLYFVGSEFDFGQMPDALAGNTLFGFSGPTPPVVYVEAVTYQGRPIPIEMGIPLDADDDDDLLPTEFALHQNYPNPFNPETQIAFDLPEPSEVTLEIYNVTGQKVRTLYEGTQSAGEHVILWDGTDDGGDRVASGIYLYRLTAGEEVATKKMLLLK